MKVGGDRRSERIERHAGLILDLVKTTPDLTLVEVRERLMTDRSEWFGISTIWRMMGALWLPRLSMITISPDRNSGMSTFST